MAPSPPTAPLARGGTKAQAAEPAPMPPVPPRPPIYEHLARPETQEEYFDGELRLKMPARPPHAKQHLRLAAVLDAHIVPGYLGAVEMLTRTSHKSDFAPDASVYPEAPDPESGERQLEELAFEIASEQDLSVPTFKARELVGRGVRRVFCIVVGGTARRPRQPSQLLEWSPELDTFSPLPPDGVIADRCFHPPLPIAGILDATARDAVVGRAELARGNPVIEEELGKKFVEGEAKGRAEGEARGRAEGEAKGEARGRAESLLDVLTLRGLEPSPPLRRRILTCQDPELLKRWFAKAMTVAAADDLLDDEAS